ncbi:hypothetical protein E1A91_D12G179500v1 [Gossypium mustelinum]|uniref:Uncharacterized protein n=2 Tax=Gossypium TaxID=3633 RepID=A0A5J5NZZ2_GOSBA|nr:hypothetical protein ES319_D12G177000v1 [Gossypium barbadense]TYI51484.1 hypothetical protein E1A91_D12G179500v1 [Gossypium mustelinum]
MLWNMIREPQQLTPIYLGYFTSNSVPYLTNRIFLSWDNEFTHLRISNQPDPTPQFENFALAPTTSLRRRNLHQIPTPKNISLDPSNPKRSCLNQNRRQILHNASLIPTIKLLQT